MTSQASHRKSARESKRRRQKVTMAEARAALAEEGRPDRDEILDLLGVQARDGHVPAMRLLLEEYRRDGDHDKAREFESSIDELAARRAG